MAVVVTVSLSFGHFAGSEHGQSILPLLLRLRRGGQLGEQVFQTAGVVGRQQKHQIVAAPDTPTAPPPFIWFPTSVNTLLSMLPSLAWWISPGA